MILPLFSQASLLRYRLSILLISADLAFDPQEAVGSYTSTDMQNSGASDKQAAVEEMRAAKVPERCTGRRCGKE